MSKKLIHFQVDTQGEIILFAVIIYVNDPVGLSLPFLSSANLLNSSKYNKEMKYFFIYHN